MSDPDHGSSHGPEHPASDLVHVISCHSLPESLCQHSQHTGGQCCHSAAHLYSDWQSKPGKFAADKGAGSINPLCVGCAAHWL